LQLQRDTWGVSRRGLEERGFLNAVVRWAEDRFRARLVGSGKLRREQRERNTSFDGEFFFGELGFPQKTPKGGTTGGEKGVGGGHPRREKIREDLKGTVDEVV